MGAADVIPGVSGGTIAFISGIYETLLASIRGINLNTIRLLIKGDIKGCWKAINGNFLLPLLAGIGASILGLSKLVLMLLEKFPEMLWSFFFGLIIASSLFVAGKVQQWNARTVISVIIGSIVAFVITSITPAETPDALWFIFLSGCLAICAMILPGISGSFILLLLGKYQYILSAVTNMNLMVVLVFAAGCVTGLTSFARLLSWMFRKQHDVTVAVLTGFMIGSLNKVWPWKVTTEFFTDRHGELQPLIQKNVLPGSYPDEPYLLFSILLCIAGFALVMLLERLSVRNTRNL